MDVYALHYIVM